jgi:hypothetical protein
MKRRLLRYGPIALLALALGWVGLARLVPPRPLDAAAFAALYATPPAPPQAPLRVFHLGHSLVARDMPAMLAQLAGTGHEHHSQLGWGASMRDHLGPVEDIRGSAVENAHPRFRPLRAAMASGAYDALVVTEMVEIRDAIRYHDSPAALAALIDMAVAGRPDIRLYLYETWHPLDDPEGWLTRLDADLTRYWEDAILRPALALAQADPPHPVWLIPAGQVLAAFVRAVEAQGGVPGIAGRADLFGRSAEGAPDMIHLNDLGHYLVALTHYAVLYQRSPVGLPHALLRADGTPADPPSPEAARLMQETVWQVVTTLPRTGVTAR